MADLNPPSLFDRRKAIVYSVTFLHLSAVASINYYFLNYVTADKW